VVWTLIEAKNGAGEGDDGEVVSGGFSKRVATRAELLELFQQKALDYPSHGDARTMGDCACAGRGRPEDPVRDKHGAEGKAGSPIIDRVRAGYGSGCQLVTGLKTRKRY